MANEAQLAKLLQGVDAWNRWRNENKGVQIDLSEADLIGTNLKGANLSRANLTGVDFRWADLTVAELMGANLTLANVMTAKLAGANLREANLSMMEAQMSDFKYATLTGACLEGWHINGSTSLTGVICDYVYLKSDRQERRPSSGNFAPGEFTKLFHAYLMKQYQQRVNHRQTDPTQKLSANSNRNGYHF
jgi:uncharacterized protein YjbI with pentapeptide repeats